MQNSSISDFTFPYKTIKEMIGKNSMHKSSIDIINSCAVLFIVYITHLASEMSKKKTLDEKSYKKALLEAGLGFLLEEEDDDDTVYRLYRTTDAMDLD